jgi:NTP pyrophosphatase (non-canonical NTP hydrolase)
MKDATELMNESDRFNRAQAARAAQARENLVSALRECGELADAVASFDGDELLEVLIALDSLRFVMAESSQILQGVVRGDQG